MPQIVGIMERVTMNSVFGGLAEAMTGDRHEDMG